MTRQPKDLQLQVAILTARVEQLQERIDQLSGTPTTGELPTAKAAIALGVAAETLRRWVGDGTLRIGKEVELVGSRYRFNIEKCKKRLRS